MSNPELMTEAHLRTAVQALAYLLAFNSVTKQPSIFDAEREAALAVILDNYEPIVRACNSHSALVAALDAVEKWGAGKGLTLNETMKMVRAALKAAKGKA